MANRCARCQKEDVTLESFGVFRCPACGLVDADGRALDASPPVAKTVATDTHDAFGAPPPWVAPDLTERARAGLGGAPPHGPPPWFAGALVVMGIIDFASAAGTHAWIPLLFELATLAALATGRPWARALSIVSSGLTILVAAFALALLRPYLPPSGGPVLVVSLVADCAWLYVLFREDTVRYFSRT